MIYSTNNVKVSVLLAFASYLRASGYNVFWHESGVQQTQTAGLSSPKAIVTLIEDVPANPSFIVRLKSESQGEEEIAVPMFTAQVLGSPERQSLLGLGHSDSDWNREVRIVGLAANARQQEALADLLHDFFEERINKELPVFNFDADPNDPPSLEPVVVEFASVDWFEVPTEVPATRYQIKSMAVLTYVE